MFERDLRYMIWVEDARGRRHAQCAAVPKREARYLLRHALPTLRPIDRETYVQCFAAVLGTAQRSSYVLDGTHAIWCLEWKPGLLVLRFSPDGSMSGTALRSPRRFFGREEPLTPSEQKAFEEEVEGGQPEQYRLVFDAWDAQFDEQVRRWNGFAEAPESLVSRLEAALEPVNALSDEAYEANGHRPEFAKRSFERLATWAGDGIPDPARSDP